jgi:hypothetical protein
MYKQMVETAEKIRSHFAVMESVPGSGYHDTDRNLTRESLFRAPQKNGFCKASENLVHFTGNYEVLFVGEDANRALSLLQKWAESPHDGPFASEKEVPHPKVSKHIKHISKLKTEDRESCPCLSLKRALWNDYIEIFYHLHQGLSGQPHPEEE